MAWQHRTYRQEQEIIDLYKYYPPKRLSKMTGFSVGVIHSVLRKYHVPSMWGRQSVAKLRYDYDPYRFRRKVMRLYWNERMSLKETARLMEIHPTTLRRRMDDLGISRRSLSEARRGVRRKPYNYRPDLPRCVCGARIKVPGASHCSACRRRPNRLRRLERGERP